MTTSNDTSTSITEEAKDRSVNELLKLTTYQGMTDSEIDSLIDYKVNIARMNGMVDAKAAIMSETNNAIIEEQKQACENSQKVLESLLSRPVTLVSNDGSMENGK